LENLAVERPTANATKDFGAIENRELALCEMPRELALGFRSFVTRYLFLFAAVTGRTMEMIVSVLERLQ
jgi:hypothetical protein